MSDPAAPRSIAAAERAAVLFTDLVGSTEMSTRHGDSAAVELVHAHLADVRESAAAHGGRLVKSTGDGCLVQLPDVVSAVRCALDIGRRHALTQPGGDADVAVRMGIHVGAVHPGDGDLYGQSVTAAARIASKASAGQVLVSDDVRAELRGEDLVEVDRGLFWLKGFPQRWRLHEVAATAEQLAAGAQVDGELTFVNRDAERAQLRSRTDRVAEAKGGVVLLAGQRGAGKSRLADETLREASQRGLRTGSVVCYQGDLQLPLRPVSELLIALRSDVGTDAFRAAMSSDAPGIARLLPELRADHDDISPPPPLTATDAQRYLRHCIVDTLARLGSSRPLVLVIDDLHRADEATVALVERVARDGDDVPVLLICTYSPEELSVSTPLQGALDVLVRDPRVTNVEVGALDRRAIAELLTSIGPTPAPPALVDQIHVLTNGSGFYVDETLRHLLATGQLIDEHGDWREPDTRLEVDISESIRVAIAQRLARLRPETQLLLELVAAAERPMSLELLTELTEGAPEDLLDALDEAEHAGILLSSDRGGSVHFELATRLTGQYLVDELSLSRRQRLHERIADALVELHGESPGDHLIDIAHHLEQAGRHADPRRTADFLRRAGMRSLEASAFETALAQLDRSLTLDPSVEPGTRAETIEAMAAAERSLGHFDEALKLWDEAIDIHEERGAAPDVARACLDAAMQVGQWHRGRSVRMLVERGVRALDDDRHPLTAGLLAVRGLADSQGAKFEQSRRLLDQAVALAAESSRPEVMGLALYSQAVHHFSACQYGDAVASGRKSAALLRRTGNVWELASALGYVGAALGWLGRFEDAADVGAQGEELARKTGNWPAVVFNEQARMFTEIGSDPCPDELERRGRETVELAELRGQTWLRSIGHTRVGLAQFWRGDWEAALDTCEHADATERTGASGGHAGRLLLLHAYLGHRADTRSIIADVRDEFAVPGQLNSGTAWTLTSAAVEGLVLLDELDEAAALYPVLLAHAETGSLMRSWDFRLVQTMCGVAAACARDWDVAAEHFARARRQARRLPMRVEAAEADRFAGTMLAAGPADLAEEAGERRQRARERYEKLGMVRHARLVGGE